MPLSLTPIYTEDPDTLGRVRDLFAGDPHAALPDWLAQHEPLAADLRAQAATGSARPAPRVVAPKVVFIDGGGRGQGRLGELVLEQIEGPEATGRLYPAAAMTGVRADVAWNEALEAAFFYARECGFGMAPGTDVRWSVRVLPPGKPWDEHLPEHRPCLIQPGEKLIGSSAGVAFFLGLFALTQGRATRGEWEARKVVERIVALATLPGVGHDRLRTLGGEEARKLDALDRLPAGTALDVVFPADYAGNTHGRHRPLIVSSIADLVQALGVRCATASRPDSLPASRPAARYIGGTGDVGRLTQAMRNGRLHVVTGQGGVGKTARVIEAAEPLWQTGAFPGGRFWINLYGAHEAGRAPEVAAAEAIATACGERPVEKLDDLRAQTRRLLAPQPGLVLLEGAETVAEADFAPLLDLFPGHTTVVWMTRRESDAQHPCLRSAAHQHVRALSPADALELLCCASGRTAEQLPETERGDWEAIATAAERLPLFLGWAGEALRPDSFTTAARYLAELRADPLGEIADPADRLRRNAGRFLRRSLARIAPTPDMPDLPAVAERLFAGLAAFHPSHGAPLAWWPLAAGFSAATADGRRRLAAARRALFGLGLITAQAPPPGAGATAETLQPVHALAAAVATSLWREHPPERRRAALGALGQAALAALAAPLPPQWFREAAWIARRTAEAAHYHHWLGELNSREGTVPLLLLETGTSSESFPALLLRQAWAGFLQNHAEPQPLLTLKSTAWTAVCRNFQLLAAAHPDVPDFQRGLAVSWDRLGDVRTARQDWAGAETAFNEGMTIGQTLAKAHPDVPDFQRGLAVSWDRLGDVRTARRDWAGAETAFNEGMTIGQTLAKAHPDVPDFQRGLAVSWERLGDVRTARQDWAGAETAFNEGMKIWQTLAKTHPDVPDFQRGLAVSWGRLGDVRTARQDWAGAETAFNEGMTIGQTLAKAHPDVPDFQRGLSVSWDRLGGVRTARQDWAGAETAFNEGMTIWQTLAKAHPDVPDFQRGLSVSWDRLGGVRTARQDWAGAETAFNEGMTIRQTLAKAHPDVPDFQRGLSVSWERLALVAEERSDHDAAETAWREALRVSEALASACSGVPLFEEMAMFEGMRLARLLRQRDRPDEAKTAACKGLARAERLTARLKGTGTELTERQRQIIAGLSELCGRAGGAGGQ